jgi:Lon protease-like protein
MSDADYEVIAIDFGRPMPVFPLADTVLLPHIILPLHIFEPRYRRMVQDALDSFGLVAMGLFKEAVSEEEYASGRPALRPYVCVGHIRQYEELEDGRYVMLLQGLCRARILSEAEWQPYRKFRVLPVDLAPPDEDALAPVRRRMKVLVGDPVMESRKNLMFMREQWDEQTSTSAMIDMAISTTCEEVEQRYRMLAEPSALKRAEWVLHRLQELRLKLIAESVTS